MDQTTTGPEKLENDNPQDKDTISPCGHSQALLPPAKKIVIIDDHDMDIVTRHDLELIAKDSEPVQPPPGLDFGEYGHTEEIQKALDKIEDHHPGLPIDVTRLHMKKIKAHPHKRALTPEQRKSLRSSGKAWWISGSH